MFVWTRSTVLAAIDAGITEVISAYNSSYQFAVMHRISVPKAYGYAFDAVCDWLNREEQLRIANIAADAALALIYENEARPSNIFDRVDAMAYAHNTSDPLYTALPA